MAKRASEAADGDVVDIAETDESATAAEEFDASLDELEDELEDDDDLDPELDEDITADALGEDEQLDEVDDTLDELDGSLAVAVASTTDEFDDDDIVKVVADDDDAENELDGLRDGEFVCRSCHLAKRETQLADAKRLLCRDCA
ncbi:MAG: hypothetical protein WD011_04720 [Nitriliruptoraceae bacterium]